MTEVTMPEEKSETTAGGYAGIVDAGNRVAKTVTNASPSGILNLITILALVVLCGVLGVKVWSEMEENRENRKERQAAEETRIREQMSRDELNRQVNTDREEKLRGHCERENEKTRKESADQIKMVLNAFLSEGDRQRTFIAAENEKFRKEVSEAIKHRPPGP